MALISKPDLESQRCEVFSRLGKRQHAWFGAGFVTVGDTGLRDACIAEPTDEEDVWSVVICGAVDVTQSGSE